MSDCFPVLASDAMLGTLGFKAIASGPLFRYQAEKVATEALKALLISPKGMTVVARVSPYSNVSRLTRECADNLLHTLSLESSADSRVAKSDWRVAKFDMMVVIGDGVSDPSSALSASSAVRAVTTFVASVVIPATAPVLSASVKLALAFVSVIAVATRGISAERSSVIFWNNAAQCGHDKEKEPMIYSQLPSLWKGLCQRLRRQRRDR